MNRSNSNVGLFFLFFLAGFLAVRMLIVTTRVAFFLAQIAFGLTATLARNLKMRATARPHLTNANVANQRQKYV